MNGPSLRRGSRCCAANASPLPSGSGSIAFSPRPSRGRAGPAFLGRRAGRRGPPRRSRRRLRRPRRGRSPRRGIQRHRRLEPHGLGSPTRGRRRHPGGHRQIQRSSREVSPVGRSADRPHGLPGVCAGQPCAAARHERNGHRRPCRTAGGRAHLRRTRPDGRAQIVERLPDHLLGGAAGGIGAGRRAVPPDRAQTTALSTGQCTINEMILVVC